MQHILGQEPATLTLRSALRNQRIHHAWIFHGPYGVGKSTTARAFATLLLDPDARVDSAGDLTSDPNDQTARLVAHDHHPDLHVIRKELALYSSVKKLQTTKLSNIPVDVLREHMIGGETSDGKFHSAIAFQSAQLGRSKVFLIEEAELLDQTGQNAILKTLEEPPPRTYIILLTTQVDRLLPTIRSRCQNVAFTPLDPESMQRWFAQSDLDLSAEERRWIESFADGSPGMAELAHHDGLYRWQTTLQPILSQLERGQFPIEFGPTLAGFVDEYASTWVKRHKSASKDAANKDGAMRVFMLLAAYLRGRLGDAAASGSGDVDRWLRLIDTVRDNEHAIQRNVNLKQVFENLAAQWGDVSRGNSASRTPIGARS